MYIKKEAMSCQGHLIIAFQYPDFFYNAGTHEM